VWPHADVVFSSSIADESARGKGVFACRRSNAEQPPVDGEGSDASSEDSDDGAMIWDTSSIDAHIVYEMCSYDLRGDVVTLLFMI